MMSDLLKRLEQFSPEKRELILKKLREQQLAIEAQNRAQKPQIVPVPKAGDLPLSFAQARLWFLDQLEGGSVAYNAPSALRLTGRLHVTALEQAIAEVVRRHEVLRTTFPTVNGNPVQRIADDSSISIPIQDLQALSDPEQSSQAQRLVIEDAQRQFDLDRGPLLRVTLLRLGTESHVLLMNLHHIVSDGWSRSIFIREAAILYEAFSNGKPSSLPELSIQYADFAHWQRQWLTGEVLETQLDYWRQQLAGAPPVLELPTDRPRPPVQTFRGGRETIALNADLTQKLKALSQQSGATLFMTLLAAFAILLARYSGQEDIVLGSAIANRNRVELEPLIGFFVNTLALRTNLQQNPTFQALLAQVRQVTLDAYTHQDLPFEKLVEELQVERTLSHSPLFQVMFVLQNAPRDKYELPGGLSMTTVQAEWSVGKFDLTLNLSETETELRGFLAYNFDLFDATTIARMVKHFQTLLEGVVVNPQQRVSDLPLMTSTEQRQLLVEWNHAQMDYPDNQCVHQLFEEQAAKTPDAIAVVFADQQLTYQALNRRANQLAHHLQALGVGPEVLVGICAERSINMIIGLLGILKAGGAYTPLDPAYPQARLAHILSDAHISLLITQQTLLERLPEQDGRVVVCLDTDQALFSQQSKVNPVSDAIASNLAYVIYTSGSTGKPKGVMVAHRGLCNLATAQIKAFGVRPDSRVLQFASLGFDASASEIFKTLLAGATLYLAKQADLLPGPTLLHLLREQAITMVTLVPSVLATLPFEELPDLETLIVAGEACSGDLLARWAPGRRCFNAYGPTEVTVCATIMDCSDSRLRHPPPMGRPIANTQVYLLDSHLNPVPVGAAGELYIGGVGLARGYINQPELTAKRFIPNPFANASGIASWMSERLYRTGDLARYRPDGNIEFLGRLDHQVKINGVRVELGEIEAMLDQHPAINTAIVSARHDGSGNQRLIAYVVPEQPQSLTSDALRSYLKEKLPHYMTPSIFVMLDALPLNLNGKVDYPALPDPLQVNLDLAKSYVAPSTELEKLLADMWQEILGVERIGVYDNFFELGGDSLKGAIFINQLQERLNDLVYVVALFDAPTVAGLAAYLKEKCPEAVAQWLGETDVLDNRLQKAEAYADIDQQIDQAKITQIRQLIEPLSSLKQADDIAASKNPSAIFILSPPRSGSTLLRVMLAGNPRLFAPPELELLSFNTLEERRAAFSNRYSFWLEGTIRTLMRIKGWDAEQAREFMADCEQQQLTVKRFYRWIQTEIREKILVDKTPSYTLDLEILKRAETDFDQPLYIHLIRHPCGAIRSFEEAKLEQVFFRYAHSFSRRELAELIWLISHQNIRNFLEEIPKERQYLIKFEDLLIKPESSLKEVCQFVSCEFHPDMLKIHENRRDRMTDGIHALSKMLGDVKFHSHKRIDPKVARNWEKHFPHDCLGDITKEVARSLGYEYFSRSERQKIQTLHRALMPITPIPDNLYLNDAEATQPSFVKPPFFCVPGAGGNPIYFYALARCLGLDQPFYGLQTPSLDGKSEPYDQVETMAADYIQAIQTVQPHGPYFLGGHSTGSRVAFEMVRQLYSRGQDVALLAIIDSTAPIPTKQKDNFDFLVDDTAWLVLLAQNIEKMTSKSLEMSYETLQPLSWDEQLNLFKTQLERINLKWLSPDTNTAQLHGLLRTFKANCQINQSYQPPIEALLAKIILLTTNTDYSEESESSKIPQEILSDPTRGWSQFSTKSVDIYQVPGDHYKITEPPYVQILAEKLRVGLAQAQTNDVEASDQSMM